MHPVVYIDVSTIRDGMLAEAKAAARRLAEFVEANMPRVLSYGFCFDDDRREMTVVALHPDSESLGYHMDVGAGEFRKFAGLIDLLRIDVYGPVTESVIERLHGKARALGGNVVAVHEYYTGFAR